MGSHGRIGKNSNHASNRSVINKSKVNRWIGLSVFDPWVQRQAEMIEQAPSQRACGKNVPSVPPPCIALS